MKSVHYYRFFFSLLSCVLLGYAIVVGITAFFRYNTFQQEYRIKKNQYDIITTRYNQMTTLANRLNDPLEWERLSRERFHMIKDGETVYLFRGDNHE